MRSHVRIAMLTAFFLVAGCSGSNLTNPDGTPRVGVTLDRALYFPGDSMVVVVRNEGSQTVLHGMGFCPVRLERQESGTWVVVPTPQSACPLALVALAPGASTTVRYQLPTGLAVGTYRLELPAPVVDAKGVTEPGGPLLTPAFGVHVGPL